MHDTIDPEDIQLRPAATMCVSGPSRSGKTTFIKKLLFNLNQMYRPQGIPNKILYCYTAEQPMYGEMRHVLPYIIFHKGLY